MKYSLLTAALAVLLCSNGCVGDPAAGATTPIPAAIRQILDKPAYSTATWSLRVVDLDSGEVIHDLHSGRRMLIGSVRKLFSVGLALDTLGADHVQRTPVYRLGAVDGSGVLNGNLVLVASGDLTMGGRTNPDGSLAIGNLDHNEANTLGNSDLTAPDPLAGYDRLARQVAAAGIRQVSGDVVIDERLYQPLEFRGEFMASPIFVNDDLVDVIVDAPSSIDYRPKSAALTLLSSVMVDKTGSGLVLKLDPELPACIGIAACSASVSGSIPSDLVPPLTGRYPLVRTLRIVQPANYARTVLIEALSRAGVTVVAAPVAPNPAHLLPTDRSYAGATQVAELASQPYRDSARFVMKVSYNLGADTSLMLYGVTQGATTLPDALAAERSALASRFGIAPGELVSEDGSGGGDTTATGRAVIAMLQGMSRRPEAAAFVDAQPQLGVDGSLASVTDFEADPTLAGAKGQVHAKTGTYITSNGQAAFYRAQALAGYISTKSGRRLAFALVVNDVGEISGINDVLPVFQDQGTISAILWKLW